MANAFESSLELLNLDVGGEFFAINITLVQEVRVLEPVRKMPDLPNGWLGVIDFRKAIVPIIDLQSVLSGTETTLHDKTIVVIVQTLINEEYKTIGIVVDAVSEVISISSNAIRQPPKVKDEQQNAVQGLFKHEGHIVVLLELGALIEMKDYEGLRSQLLDTSNV